MNLDGASVIISQYKEPNMKNLQLEKDSGVSSVLLSSGGSQQAAESIT